MLPATELTYFIEVANTQNLSRASEKLGISQPSLSVAIKRLETSVGTNLLIRHKRGVTLTQAGKQLLTNAKKLLQDWDDMRAQSLAAHSQIQGTVTLGCHPSLALRYLPTFLPNLLSKHPNLNIQLFHDISRNITEKVINLSVDVAIVVNPMKHADLIIRKLNDDTVTFWQAANNTRKAPSLQSGLATIICDPELPQPQSLLKKIRYARILSSSNLELIANLTAHGCGIGILPTSIASHTSKLKPVLNAGAYHDQICLIYRHENRDIKIIKTVIEAIKQSVK